LRSVVRQGHRVALYCYREPSGIPDHVEVRDASEILPLDRVPKPWLERVDLYSDWFRYELLQRGLGTWVDTDVYLLAPLETERPYLFGIEEHNHLNNAVFRLPPDSPLLQPLLEPFLKQTTPRWMSWRYYIPVRAHELVTGRADLTEIPWATTGPKAVTYLARKYGLHRLAEPQERFYPVPWQRADWILNPERTLEDVIGEGTVAVHLWNRCISAFKNEPAPPGSFLDRLHREGRM